MYDTRRTNKFSVSGVCTNIQHFILLTWLVLRLAPPVDICALAASRGERGFSSNAISKQDVVDDH